MHFLDLPNEMIDCIVSSLPAESLSAISQTCRKLREVAKNDALWQSLCRRDYQVPTNRGWTLSFQAIYCKVLIKYGFLGLKRLALLPYGGLVHVCWAEGEIQVRRFIGRDGEARGPVSGSSLVCELLYVLRWNDSINDMDILCVQSDTGPRPAVLVQSGKYPWLSCADKVCYKTHKRKESRWGQTGTRCVEGFPDHPDAFKISQLDKGFNCPLLPVPIPSPEDQVKSPIQLGLYVGNYGLHGDEVLNLAISQINPSVLEGLKIIGDPNVFAGYMSITVFLDKPIILSEEDQVHIFNLQETDEARSDASFEELRNSNNNNPDLQQPFRLPVDCFDRGQETPRVCLARYLGLGRIAGHFYSNPSHCKCHFIKFSDDKFGVLWLDLSSFSMFCKVEEEFSICQIKSS